MTSYSLNMVRPSLRSKWIVAIKRAIHKQRCMPRGRWYARLLRWPPAADYNYSRDWLTGKIRAGIILILSRRMIWGKEYKGWSFMPEITDSGQDGHKYSHNYTTVSKEANLWWFLRVWKDSIIHLNQPTPAQHEDAHTTQSLQAKRLGVWKSLWRSQLLCCLEIPPDILAAPIQTSFSSPAQFLLCLARLCYAHSDISRPSVN
jgi:hypothetical protein